MLPLSKPRIYHILHCDRLQSVLQDGFLYSDAIISSRAPSGTAIGMSTIKQRRRNELTLSSHPDLYVGACVPFYYCPRSIMLYMLHKGNEPALTYGGGQAPIVHLEFDLQSVSDWATKAGKRWAITKGNAGSRYFDDYSSLANHSGPAMEPIRHQGGQAIRVFSGRPSPLGTGSSHRRSQRSSSNHC
jgi:hypothetical protein